MSGSAAVVFCCCFSLRPIHHQGTLLRSLPHKLARALVSSRANCKRKQQQHTQCRRKCRIVRPLIRTTSPRERQRDSDTQATRVSFAGVSSSADNSSLVRSQCCVQCCSNVLLLSFTCDVAFKPLTPSQLSDFLFCAATIIRQMARWTVSQSVKRTNSKHYHEQQHCSTGKQSILTCIQMSPANGVRNFKEQMGFLNKTSQHQILDPQQQFKHVIC